MPEVFEGLLQGGGPGEGIRIQVLATELGGGLGDKDALARADALGFMILAGGPRQRLAGVTAGVDLGGIAKRPPKRDKRATPPSIYNKSL